MLDEGLIAHVSGEAMHTFLYGFYFYRIVDKENEKGEEHIKLIQQTSHVMKILLQIAHSSSFPL